MTAPTVGFQGIVRAIKETTEGGGMPNSGTVAIFSDSVSECAPMVDMKQSTIRDIGSRDPVAYLRGAKRVTLHIKFRHQDVAGTWTMLQDWLGVNLTNARLPTYCFEIQSNKGGANVSYYTVAGAKVDTIGLEVDADGYLVWDVAFKALDMSLATALPILPGTTTRQNAVNGTTYFTYLGAALTVGGAAAAFATSKFGFTVNHHLAEILDVGSATVKSYAEGERELSWKGTLTADDGGNALFAAAVNATQGDVVIKSSTTSGKPKITLTTTQLPSMEMKLDDTAAMVSFDVERPALGLTAGTTP